MKKLFIPGKINGTILVYVDSNSYSPSTIQRGSRLAKAFGCPFHVWFGISKAEEIENKDELDFTLSESKKMSIYFGAASFITSMINTEREFKSAFNTIKLELSVTQLVLTSSIESRLEEFIYGSTVNYLLRRYRDLELHFVSHQLAFPYEDWEYEKGKVAVLKKLEKGYILSSPDEKGVKGIFFREKATNFETGIFLTTDNNQINVYNIFDGNVTKKHRELYTHLKRN